MTDGGGLFGYCQSSAIKPHPNSTDEVNLSIFFRVLNTYKYTINMFFNLKLLLIIQNI